MIYKTVFTLSIIIMTGCVSSANNKVVAANPKDTQYLDDRYSMHDQHKHVKAMILSMLRTPKVFKDQPRPPRIALGDINIGVGIEENIDVNAIKKSIRTNLIKSGKAIFIDVENIKLLENQIDYQNNSKYINPSTAQKKGQFIAAEYILSGDISAIKNSNETISKTVYTLNLKLTKIKSGEVSWSEEKEIHKALLK